MENFSFRRVCLLASILFAGSASAQVVPATSAGSAFGLTTVANVSTVNTLKADLANFAKISYETGALGDITTKGKGSLVHTSGAVDIVDVVAKVPKSSVVAALGKFVAKGVPFINTATAFWELAQDLGFRGNGSGGMVRDQTTPGQTVVTATCDVTGGNGIKISRPSCAEALNFIVENYVSYAPAVKECNLTYPATSPCRFSGLYGGWNEVSVSWPSAPTTTYQPPVTTTVPATGYDVVDAVSGKTSFSPSSPLARAVVDAIKAGVPDIDLQPQSVTGPASSAPSSVTVNNGNNTSTTTTTTNYYEYGPTTTTTNGGVTITNGPTITNNPTTTITVTNNTTGAVISSTVNNPRPGAPAAEIETCGLPGKPACKIDETGTPTQGDAAADLAKIAALKTEADRLREIIGGKADKPFFAGWDVFFSAPALADCEPFVLPRDYGQINACPVVDGTRVVMSYLWALGGLALCLGMIKRTF